MAFFDFDNTLIEGDAGPLFGWYLFLWRRHELEGHRWRRLWLWTRYLPFIAGMGVQLVFYRFGAVRRSTIVRASYQGLKRVPAAAFYGLMDEFAEEALVPRIYPEMRAELLRHMAQGGRCVVVTTGIEVLVRKVLDRIDSRIELIGCRMIAKKGCLTGDVEGPVYGLDKANIIHAFARALGVPLEKCAAYTDHWSDKHMLQIVGTPVVVNPRGRLLRLARRRGWVILQPQLAVTSSTGSSSPT
ncbi:MAG: HAD family hydrolase [Thermoplasmatota archaeon]